MSGAIGPGVFVAVVGASGVGKDSIIDWARNHTLPGAGGPVFPRRIITREAGRGEDHHYADDGTFLAEEARGAFAVTWRAHGLAYGIPLDNDAIIRAGGIVVANVSRTVLPTLLARYEQLRVVRVEVSESLRRERIAGRGREAGDDIEERIARQDPAPAFPADIVIVNDRTVDEAGREFLGFLEGIGTSRPAAAIDAARAPRREP